MSYNNNHAIYKKLTLAVLLLCAGWYTKSYIIQYADICFRALYSAIAYPCIRLSYSIYNPLCLWIDAKSSMHELQQTIRQLRSENHVLQQTVVNLRSTLNFDDLTSSLVEYQQRFSHSSQMLCQIIGRAINKVGHTCIINKGSYHGVQKDMVAVWYNNIIGRVYEIYPYFSHILLVTDQRSYIPVYSLESQAQGISQGSNNPEYINLEYVEHCYNLTRGMNIYTSGQGIVFPQGFNLGELVECSKGPLYYKARVKIPYSFNDIDYCYLLTKGVVES